ncbi:MAG: HAMP domain-containing protein [Nitrospirae bacterium]|nr:HAMP domain-containing protein [Nitrospirota bacterium]
MKSSDIKFGLKTKVLWIPVIVVALTFVILGVFLSKLIISNGKVEFIKGKENQLLTALSLITSSQLPADAYLGLESGDDGIAGKLIAQVKGLGLDGVYFTTVEGEGLYPKDTALPDSLHSLIGKSGRERGVINAIFDGNKIIGFAPIIDVETPKGFLVFAVNIPDELADTAISVFSDKTGSGKTDSSKFLKKVLITLASTLIPALILIVFILGSSSRNIINSVRKLLDAFNLLSRGDLTQEIHIHTGDEIAELAAAFNETNLKLNEMVNKVAGSSHSVASSAGRLFASSSSIADNARNQSEKTTQTATSMEELNTSFVNVAQNSLNAAGSAKQATELAVKGGEIVSETIGRITTIAQTVNESAGTIGALGKRSEQIGEIVKVINEIAGQTNLLALNAAIEAARAGEQGRGFAVVADEVRKLAERTTAATNEIGEMIKGIQDDTLRAVQSMQSGTLEVEEGVKSANQAGQALEQIVESVQNVTDMIQQIATAAEEQSSTGEEIARNLESVANVTKQTADAVQTSSQSTQDLNILAQELQKIVSGFNLRGTKTVDNPVTCKNVDYKSGREMPAVTA